METLSRFRETWVVDTEYHSNQQNGNEISPVCLVAKEIRSGKVFKLWRDQLLNRNHPPFPIDKTSLIVTFFGSAEMQFFKVLGWRQPINHLDCFVEARVAKNKIYHGARPGRGLLAVMQTYGFASMGEIEKTGMRDLILTGGPWTIGQQKAIMEYCLGDVLATEDVFGALVSVLKDRQNWLYHALLRGRYMNAVGAMVSNGIPIDMDLYHQLTGNWENLKLGIIEVVKKEFPVYEGTVFKQAKFEALLNERGIPWPRTETGKLELKSDTFRQKVKIYPSLAPLHEARNNLGQLSLNSLEIGSDGRNRALLSPFGAVTGRNTPSTSKFIFGNSAWLRGLIKPEKGTGIVSCDFNKQEVVIAAVLSGDKNLLEICNKDPYLESAKLCGHAPLNATKETHASIRHAHKQTILGVQYGMRSYGLSNALGISLYSAEKLVRSHKDNFPQYWDYIKSLINYSRAVGYIETCFGWRMVVNPEDVSETALQNFPCQANGAEMLRVACIMANEAGLKIIAPVHDAILIESDLAVIDQEASMLQEIMREAGRTILGNTLISSDKTIIKYPDRYYDERGVRMWGIINGLLRKTKKSIRYG